MYAVLGRGVCACAVANVCCLKYGNFCVCCSEFMLSKVGEFVRVL
jgi:hypothetical protein